MRCIILDLESTGLHPEKGDVIIDVAAIIVGPDGIEDRFQSLVHPGSTEVSPFIEAMTGISRDMLKDAPDLRSVLAELHTFIGEDLPIVGHNISFDANFLTLSGLPIPGSRLVDTCDFASIYFLKAPSHSLEVLSTYLQLEHTEKHRAMGDVLATYELLRCLTTARDAFGHEHAVQSLKEKAAAWSGLQFFDLQVPPREIQIAQESPGDVSELAADSRPGITRFQLRPSVERTVQWAMAQGAPAVLVAPGEAETMRDLVLTEGLGHFFDNPEHYLDPQAAADLLALPVWGEEVALFCFRLLLFAQPGRYVHQNALSISHRERALFATYGAREDQVPAIIADAQGPLFLTYGAWHRYKEHLPQDRLWIISDAMRLELSLHQSAKTYMSLDSLTSRLKSLAARCEAHAIPVSDLVESLEYVIRYAFTGMAKLLRSDQRELVLEGVPELLQQFQQTWKKGMEQWASRLTEEPGLEKQRAHLEKSVDAFLAGMADPEKSTTLCRLPQGILLQQERRSLENERAWFQGLARCHLLQGYIDERFSLFLQPKETVVLDALELPKVTLEHARSQQLAGEMGMVDMGKAILGTPAHHVIMSTGSGATLDKAFDILYDTFHGEEAAVLSSGKTGGRGKVRFGFTHGHRTMLVATAPDAKGLGVTADALVITTLPFPPTMSSYWTARYGDNNFGTLSLPLMTQQIVDLAWAVAGETLSFYIADGRVFEKQYGQELIHALSAFMQVA